MKHKTVLSQILAATCCLVFSATLNAQIYVDGAKGVDAAGGGTTWETAYKTIFYAIWASNYGDTPGEVIYVKEGTYVEDPNHYETNDGNSFSKGLTNGNLPALKNIIIKGAISNLATGTDSCGYSPAIGISTYNRKTIITLANPISQQGLFRMRKWNGNLTLQGLYIKDINTWNENKGAVLTMSEDCTGKTFSIEDSYVDNCQAGTTIPAFYIWQVGGNTLNFKNSVFQNCKYGVIRQYNGGNNTINVENCEFKANTYAGAHGGGAICLHQKPSATEQIVTIKNSSFCDNTRQPAFSGAGGAIIFTGIVGSGGYAVTIDKSTFYNNLSSLRAGAIFAENTALTLTNSKFGKNKSFLGGGAVFLYNSSVTASGNTFTENNASGDGGIANGGSYAVEGMREGAVYPAFSFKNETFLLNKAQNFGGAVWVGARGDVGNQVVFDNCRFGQNSAKFGGGIYSSAEMIVKNSYFDANKADNSMGGGKGGGVFSNNSGLYIQNNCFYKNYAVNGGSGVFAEDLVGSTSRMFSIPAGYTTSIGSSVTTLRHIAENNMFYANTSAWFSGNILGDDGVEGGALVYKWVRGNSSISDKDGNIALMNNKFYHNVMYYTDALIENNNAAAGVTFRGLDLGNHDNVVLFQGNEFVGNKRGPSNTGVLSSTLPRVDVSVLDYNDAAIFQAINNKLQLDNNEVNYPSLKKPPALDWQGFENVSGNTFGHYNDVVADPGCSVTAPLVTCTPVLVNVATPECDPLPAIYGSANAVIKNNNLYITWTTLSESNFDHFNIEASTDGVHFKQIGIVKSKAANGNSSLSIDYNFEKTIKEIAVMGAGFVPQMVVAMVLLLVVFSLVPSFRRSRKAGGAVALVCIVGMLFAFSCRKADFGGEKTMSGKQVYIKITGVDIDGKENTSKIIKAVYE